MGGPRTKRLLGIAGLMAIYFATARFGLSFGAVNRFATLVWPPSGISLAVLLVFGLPLWPGVALGAFLANWSIGASPLVAFGVAAGNTLEAVIGAYLLRKAGLRRSLDSLKSVLALILLGALLSTLVSAIIGTVSLLLNGTISTHSFGATWIAWWYGDLMGDLVVAPFLLVWSASVSFKAESIPRIAEILGLAALVVLSSLALFTDIIPPSTSILFPQPYFIFPVMLIVAFRLAPRGTASALLAISIIAVGGTATGHGILWTGSLSDSLLQVQIFLSIVGISSLLLAATVAERRREREALRLSNAKRKAIALENARLYRDAQEALQSRDEFLSIASHELKTPLTTLSLQLQMFNRMIRKDLTTEMVPEGPDQPGNRPSLPAKSIEIAEKCEKQSKKLAVLLEELLDLTRIRLGRLQLAKDTVDLRSMSREITERFRAEAQARGSVITLRSRASTVGHWDPLRIEQVISNLLSNAIKYGDAKPISVRIIRDDRKNRARLLVRDHGLGVSRDMQERIFERFERADSHRGKIQGLGLGLYISKQIVEAHQGTIRVLSGKGGGSIFIVDLPLARRLEPAESVRVHRTARHD